MPSTLPQEILDPAYSHKLRHDLQNEKLYCVLYFFLPLFQQICIEQLL